MAHGASLWCNEITFFLWERLSASIVAAGKPLPQTKKATAEVQGSGEKIRVRGSGLKK
jgi:hypothetical protein